MKTGFFQEKVRSHAISNRDTKYLSLTLTRFQETLLTLVLQHIRRYYTRLATRSYILVSSRSLSRSSCHLITDRTLNRELLSRICFGDPAQLRKLNQIMSWCVLLRTKTHTHTHTHT